MNVLIIGLGSIAKKHIDVLYLIEKNTTIYALRSKSNMPQYRNVINIENLDNIGVIDFIIISNPTSEHLNTILSLLELKIPLFIEKPIANEIFEKDLLEKISVENKTYIACNLRFLDCICYLKKNITSLKINEVNVYCGSYLPDWRKTDFRNSYSVNPALGGGVHLDLIHEIDYIYWLFGKPKEVYSIFRNVSTLNIESYDYANYNLIYDNFCANVVLNYYRRDAKRSIELVMDNGTWFVDLYKNKIYSNNDIIFESTQTISDTYRDQMQYYLLSLNSKSFVMMNDINEAYEVLNIALNN